MNRFLIGLIILACYSNVNAQNASIEFKLDAVYPLIHDLEKTNTIGGVSSAFSPGYINLPSSSLEENYSGNLSYNAEFIGHFSLGKKVTMSFGFGIQYLKFKKEDLVIVNDNSGEIVLGRGMTSNYYDSLYGTLYGVPFGGGNEGTLIDRNSNLNFPERDPSVSILYLEVPLSFDYNITSKLEANLGISLAQRIYSKTKGYEYYYANSGFQTKEVTYKDGRGFNLSQLFLSAGVSYNVWKNIYTSISYKRSMTPIYDTENQIAGKAKYNILGIGLSYRFQLPKQNQEQRTPNGE